MAVIHDAAEPLYIQIRELILGDIRSGKYSIDERLPSERVFSGSLDVSRMTVRQALNDLQRMGAIYARVGKGTFVAAPKIDQQLQAVTSFTQEMRARGAVPSSRVLKAAVVPATVELAAELEIATGVPVVLLERVRLADGMPLAIETAYIPHAVAPGLLEHDFTIESLYEVLAAKYRLTLTAASQTIEASLADDAELGLLEVEPPAAVLRMRRLSRSAGGAYVELVLSTYRGDRYQLRSRLESKRRSL